MDKTFTSLIGITLGIALATFFFEPIICSGALIASGLFAIAAKMK